MASQATSDALTLASRGEAARAVALLETAGRGGDVDALMQHAVWHLAGHPVPRDLVKARALLRAAVTIGHVDGALMEIALTANGSGASPDWAQALARLRHAARNDVVAAEQHALVEAMTLAVDGRPAALPQGHIVNDEPRIVRYPGFLTPKECAHVASVAGALLEPSAVLDPRTGRSIAHPIRSSDSGAIGPAREDLVIRAINLRLAAASATDVSQGEPLTVLRYRVGQQYRPHLDTIEGAKNQRLKTALIYLNEGFAGGETHFPSLSVTITPRAGEMVLFENTLRDGRPDPRLRHAGLPIRSGVKWLATRWIRAHAIDPWTMHLTP